jgi:hypothetical protein
MIFDEESVQIVNEHARVTKVATLLHLAQHLHCCSKEPSRRILKIFFSDSSTGEVQLPSRGILPPNL